MLQWYDISSSYQKQIMQIILCAHQSTYIINKTYIFNILRLQLVSFSHCTSSNVRVDNVTRLTIVSHIGQGNVLRLDNSLSTQDVQLFCIITYNI